MWKKVKLLFLRWFGGPCFNCGNSLDLNYSIIFLKDNHENSDNPTRIRFRGSCTDEFLHKTKIEETK